MLQINVFDDLFENALYNDDIKPFPSADLEDIFHSTLNKD
jgi:hypothetical protein